MSDPTALSASAATRIADADHHVSSFVALRHAVGSAWALLVGITLLMLGTGLQGSLLGLRADFEGFDTTTVGVVMSSYYLGYLLGSTQAPKLVATVGHIRVFAAFASIASSTVLLHALAVAPAGWVAFRVASGFCMAGLFVVAESWLNDTATNETRGSMLSLYGVVVSGGMGAGQLLLNLADPSGFELFILTSVLVSLALVPAALSVRSAPRFLQPTPVRLKTVMEAAPLGVVGAILSGAASSAIFGVGVIYAQLRGLTLAETATFMLVAILGGAVLQWPIGWLSDHTDRRRIISAAAAVAAGLCVVGTMGPNGLVLLVVIGLLGGFSLPLYPLVNAHTNDWIAHEQMVGAGSRLIMSSGMGAIGGPILASTAMATVGAAGFFWFLTIVHVAVAVFAAWRIVVRPPRPVGEQTHFAAVPARGSSVLVSAMYPEAYDEEDEPLFDTEEIPVVVVDDE
ncbi:MAG: MFS transporter [Acidimicrobiales bacterium]